MERFKGKRKRPGYRANGVVGKSKYIVYFAGKNKSGGACCPAAFVIKKGDLSRPAKIELV